MNGDPQLLLRAAGPALEPHGVNGFAADPLLTVFNGETPIANNDNWNAADAQVSGAILSSGAFAFPAGSRDAAMVIGSLGSLSAHVTSPTPGVTLAEIYRVPGSGGRLINLSTRSHAGSGEDTMIAGFVIEGEGQLRLLLRGIGPTLTQYQVPNALADPVLVLYRGNTVIDTNDDWKAEDAAAMAGVAFALPVGSKDAALVVSLGGGVYSLHVRGANNSSGTALAEVYVLP